VLPLSTLASHGAALHASAFSDVVLVVHVLRAVHAMNRPEFRHIICMLNPKG
jgi:hypothetical protein